ncbi:GPI transamidase subunit PIG-U [Pterulicium gracile]|uniref:GPI transamidase subunit PIG-U n=1 Tax=Pterulicium gracile TaxID=1884261 RepID=A0A5C3QSB6_9AGAR|nr:GPI transamidase subunit PIG-U [Pterula gracilis]
MSATTRTTTTTKGLGVSLGATLSTITALRICLAFTKDVSTYLQYEQLLSSPLTSYTRLQEGLFLFNHDVDPYSGGLFYHSPLYLSIFSTIIPNSRFIASLLWTFADALGAWALVQIWRARQGVSSPTSRDSLVAVSYLLNPYTLLPSLALSTSSLENTLTLLAIMLASQRLHSPSLLALALLITLNPSSILLLAPVLLLLAHPTGPKSNLASPSTGSVLTTPLLKKTVLPLFAEFFAYIAVLVGASALTSGGWSWVGQNVFAGVLLPDLTPNTGLWWYFFTEMFDHFRPFFLMVFTMHLLIYIAPICVKFQHDPLFATLLLQGILGTFKAYPTLADPGLFIAMVSVFPEIYSHLRHPIVTTLLHIHAALLLPLFNHLWLAHGAGNANFFYASTLVFACANGAGVLDCLWAGLRVGIEKLSTGEKASEDVEEEWTVVQE